MSDTTPPALAERDGPTLTAERVAEILRAAACALPPLHDGVCGPDCGACYEETLRDGVVELATERDALLDRLDAQARTIAELTEDKEELHEALVEERALLDFVQREACDVTVTTLGTVEGRKLIRGFRVFTERACRPYRATEVREAIRATMRACAQRTDIQTPARGAEEA